MTGYDLQTLRLPTNVAIVQPGGRSQPSRLGGTDVDQPVGIRIRERLQQDTFDYSEHGGVGTDSESEREYRQHGESGRTSQLPPGVTEVSNHNLH